MASSSAVEISPEVLATLATKADLAPLATREEVNGAIAVAVAPLATREELRAAVAEATAPLATREELKAAIAPLATRAELDAMRTELRGEIREEGERTRRYFDVVAERLESSISVVADGYTHLDAKIDGVRTELKDDIAALDRRVTRLETRRRSR